MHIVLEDCQKIIPFLINFLSEFESVDSWLMKILQRTTTIFYLNFHVLLSRTYASSWYINMAQISDVRSCEIGKMDC